VNIKPMLVRLEGALDRNDLMEQMVLLPEPASAASKWSQSTKSVNLVVGYNASPKSQTALDLTMWIAHQTRLVTQKQVTVQVVYVVAGEHQNRHCAADSNSVGLRNSLIHQLPSSFSQTSASNKSATSLLSQAKSQALADVQEQGSRKNQQFKATCRQSDWLEQAERILYQAECLAQEWRSSFKTHLRFGDVATELRDVVESEAATLLFLGCNCVNHPLVEKLDDNFPCSVLGIPKGLSLSKG
jgi:hypothetical protein